MVRTRVGYTGGTRANPTYRAMGDHAEAIQLDFDPARLSYAELLELFWADHDPDHEPYKRQYMSAIWPGDPEQLRIATLSRQQHASRAGKKLFTEIAPLGIFTLAEDYHQKYYLRSARDLMRAFDGDSPADFVRSRVAARLNGVLGRYADRSLIESELPRYGLQPELADRVRQLAGARRLP